MAMIRLFDVVSANRGLTKLHLSKVYETEVKNNSKIRNQYVWAKSTQYESKYTVLTFSYSAS